ncbi:uncharacterized protein LOC132633062 isoform X1 [Lycium barbarum]|uniref:uncharacterized protein LOC132633062 isoform X1 n=1 Tax=Lycium barbarum TaxID=112863 RepID=UPI00293F2AA5|nr:uncharacterized protein LOC132633062 isoform X1 [Lycium barbarum]XP_060205255.1 uncharacterized protein LOC132633062 isoform X1 [Lycium barbarum]
MALLKIQSLQNLQSLHDYSAYHYPLGRFVLLHPAAADYPLVYLLLIALHSDSFQHLLLSSIHEKLHLDPHHLVVFLQVHRETDLIHSCLFRDFIESSISFGAIAFGYSFFCVYNYGHSRVLSR